MNWIPEMALSKRLLLGFSFTICEESVTWIRQWLFSLPPPQKKGTYVCGGFSLSVWPGWIPCGHGGHHSELPDHGCLPQRGSKVPATNNRPYLKLPWRNPAVHCHYINIIYIRSAGTLNIPRRRRRFGYRSFVCAAPTSGIPYHGDWEIPMTLTRSKLI